MLNPVHLQTLTTVIRLGSFADAARHLGYSGSAVSQQMSALERQLKVTLFERDAHGIRATPNAADIVHRSAGVLGALRALEDDIAQIAGGLVGRLRIGSFPTASEQLLPGALARLQRIRPHLHVHLDEDEPAGLVAMLERRTIDVALLYRYRGLTSRWPQSIDLRPLLVEDLLLVRAEMGGRVDGGQGDLASQVDATWIATGEDTRGAATLRRLCHAAGFEPRVSYRSNNYGVIQGLVASGAGVALIPAMAYKARAGLSATPLSGNAAAREVVLASASPTPPKLVHVFETTVRKAGEKLVRQRSDIRLTDR